MQYMCSMGSGRVCREYSTAVDLSLLVVECTMELSLDIIGECFTTLYQMSKPTYLSRDVFALLEIGILTYINHGGQVARLPVSYTSSLSFCHSSHVVVYFILLSVVSKFCSGLRGIFFFTHRPKWETGAGFTCTEYTLHILSNHFCVNRHFQLFYLTREMFISNN